MLRHGQVIMLVWLGVGLGGCLNVDLDKPLVDLGNGGGEQVQRVHDPAPGVADAELTREQQLQRDLAITQDRLAKAQCDLKKEKAKRDADKKKYEHKKDTLEDQIEALEKENKRLRKAVRGDDDD